MKKIITLGLLASLLFPLSPAFANYTLENCTTSYDANDKKLFDNNSYFYQHYYIINPSLYPDADEEQLEHYSNLSKEALSLVKEINKRNNFTQKLNFGEDQAIIFSHDKQKYAFKINENNEFLVIENGKTVKRISQKFDDNGNMISNISINYRPNKLFIVENIYSSPQKNIIYTDKKSFEFEGNYFVDIIDDERYILADPNSVLPAKLVKNGQVIKEIPNYSKTILLKNNNKTKYVIKQNLFHVDAYGSIFNLITESGTYGPFGNLIIFSDENNIVSTNNDWYTWAGNIDQQEVFIKEAQKLKKEIEALGIDLYDSHDTPAGKKLKELFNKHISTKNYIIKNGETISQSDTDSIFSILVANDNSIIQSKVKTEIAKNLKNEDDIVKFLEGSQIFIGNALLINGYVANKLSKDQTKIEILTVKKDENGKYDEISKLCDLKNSNIKGELKNDSPEATYKLSAQYIKSIKKLAKEINALGEPRKTKMKNKLITLRGKYKYDSPQYAILQELLKLIK